MPTNAINDTGVKYLYDKLHGEIEPIAEAVSDSEVTIEGNPINFTTLSAQKSKSTILSLEPIQDLHGYDKPWVGGAGKNLISMTVDSIKSANTSGTWSGNAYTVNNVTFTVITDSDNNVIGINANGTASSDIWNFVLGSVYCNANTQYILNGCPSGKSESTEFLQTTKEIIGSGDNHSDTGSGVTFSTTESKLIYVRIVVKSGYNTNNSIFYPMLRLATETDATFAPYTNVCAISGRTEIGILGCGKNLLEAIESGAVDDHGIESENNLRCRCNDYIEVKPNEKYTFSATTTQSKTLQCYIRYFADNLDSYNIGNSGWKSASTYTFTTPNDCNYLKIILRFSDDSSISTTYITDAQLEQGETPTQYIAYQQSNDLTISLGQTVYGGTLDVENGVLVVDRGYTEINGTKADLMISGSTIDSQGGTEIRTSVIAKPPLSTTTIANIIADRASADTALNLYNNPTPNTIGVTGSGNIALRYKGTNTLSDAQSALNNEPINVCYELATPITINLTPHTINLLKGVNNISTDGDKITLTYRDGSVATLGDLTSAVDSLDSKIDESKILTDTVTGDKYILVVTNGTLSIEQISN